jgi:threonine/homoserine/homoserine lactone efflux protein
MNDLLATVNLPLFIPAALVLLLTPGPVVLYIITRSIDQGRRAGLVSVLGSELGNLFHAFAAAFGLSAILLSSALAFDVVKYAGAAYLIYLGIRKLRSSEQVKDESLKPDSLRRIFLQGIMVAILNPKTALFFFAFLPQFVDTTKGNIGPQLLFLGIIFVSMAIISDGLYALLAGYAGRWLKGNRRFLQVQKYVTGTVYLGLGVTAALATGSKK